MRQLQRELTRRGLLAGAGTAAVALSGLARAAQALPLPPLAPTAREVRRTMAAFADTVVPGPAGGAHPDPGAIEAGAVEEMYEPFYGAAGAFPLLHEDLQLTTPRVLGRAAPFDLDLPYPDRERVLIDRITATGEGGQDLLYVLYLGTATLVYLSYYGTARSDLGPRYIGFPPESEGYYPGHSYGAVFEEMTPDGNPP